MNLLRQGIRQLLTACLPTERWLVRGRRARGIDGVAISLTFDDGPHPEYTPQVLDRLQTYGWKGTFFVVGERAAAHPDLIRRIVREGHELGNHSYTHSEPSQTTAAALIDEVRRVRQLLQELTGNVVDVTRPPKGALTWSKLRGLWAEGQTVVLWNVDPKDYRPGREVELRRWGATYDPRSGDIVLLHDSLPHVLSILDTLQEHGRLVGTETVPITAWLERASARPAAKGTSAVTEEPSQWS
jgi:peptidoglycan/xylan/chitin deacetylase (PgdA/CDA1 family)